ncbi:MAG TPA: NAD(P)H-hydrate epimerase, partial [Eggerthellaceae bacterium]|nr:NAD(P)H-hydrate epimerase [Eggerthellaceae bacterium]
GNNGGDGWVAARELAARGHDVALVSARKPEDLKAQPAADAAMAARSMLESLGARIWIAPNAQDCARILGDADVIVDALLGTGFSGATVKAPFDTWITAANERRRNGAIVVSADAPSGLNAQTGETSQPTVRADETITMIVSKPGLELPASAAFCGTVRVAPLAYLEQ